MRPPKRKLIKRVPVKKHFMYKTMKNVNPLKSDTRLVSITKGIDIPQYVKTFMSTLTQHEQNLVTRESTREISTQYNMKFNKNTFTVELSSPPADDYTKRVVEYAVRTNLNSMTPKHKIFIKKHWNGYVLINIKKLARVGNAGSAYFLPWHRDAHYMQTEGVRYKGFAVGALYVNRPDLPGGNIQFAAGRSRYGLVPPSGTSVTFLDDDIFHRVVPVQAPPDVKLVPRSAFFLVYGTDEKGPFKMGIHEQNIMERNYEKFFRGLDPRQVQILNKNLESFTNQNKRNLNQAAQFFFKKPNATHVNVKALYNNMKTTLGHSVYEDPAIKALLNKNTLTNQNKATLNAFAKRYFMRNTATHANVKTLYNSLKKTFGGQLGIKENASFVALIEPRYVKKIRTVSVSVKKRPNTQLNRTPKQRPSSSRRSSSSNMKTR